MKSEVRKGNVMLVLF